MSGTGAGVCGCELHRGADRPITLAGVIVRILIIAVVILFLVLWVRAVVDVFRRGDLSGGAKACAQYLKAGLVDEMELHQVPILLGRGERLFDGAGDDLQGLELVRVAPAPGVTHLKFVRRPR